MIVFDICIYFIFGIWYFCLFYFLGGEEYWVWICMYIIFKYMDRVYVLFIFRKFIYDFMIFSIGFFFVLWYLVYMIDWEVVWSK